VPIVALCEREEKKIVKVSIDLKGERLKRLVKRGNVLLTDEYIVYKVMERFYEGKIVNHSKEIYAEGERHVNTCECEFSLMRLFLMIHRGVAKYNLPLYVSLYGFCRQVGEWGVEGALVYVLAVMVGIFLFAL